MKNQKKYDREFKLNAVKLYQESGISLEKLALDLGIPMSTLATWVKQFEEHGSGGFPGSGSFKVWVSDITYIATQEGWLYVAIVTDLFSRKIVGLTMSDRLQTELVIKALRQALFHREVKGGLIHHSDKGSQYTSKEFKELAVGGVRD